MESTLLNALIEQGPFGMVCVLLIILYIKKDNECKAISLKLDKVYEEAIEALTKAREESEKRAEGWAKEFTDILKGLRR